MSSNAKYDLYISKFIQDIAAAQYVGGKAPLQGLLVSPLHANLKGFPPFTSPSAQLRPFWTMQNG